MRLLLTIVATLATTVAATACATSGPPPVRPAAVEPATDQTTATPASREARVAIMAAVEAPDRSAEDRALDAGRKPVETLAFFGVAPGMKVAEMGAGRGYGAELLARIVGPEGQVIGHNSPFLLERFAEGPWTERLTKPVMANVVRSDRPFEAPFDPAIDDLDVVLNVLFYHDTYWQGVDREAMNRAIFAALEPGGVYGIVDHSAAEGRGAEDVQTLHRVEEALVIAEIEAAGFILVETADFLRNPDDTRDWNAAPGAAGERRGQSDRFVLKFVKPR